MYSFKQQARSLACAVGLAATALLSACGGGGDQGRDPILGVPAAPLLSVAVSPAAASIALGGAQQFTAIATYGDGASRDVTTESAWVAATPAVATVGASTGLARPVSTGTTNITATFGGKAGVSVLTVTPATLSSIQIAPLNPSVNAGVMQQFTATGTFSDNTTRDITAITTFTSATPAVASIVATTGMTRGLTAGTSVITATSGGRSSSTTLTVTPAVLVSLAIAPTNPTLQIAALQQMTTTAVYSDGRSVDVTASSTYVSATPAVATIGAATGLTRGVAAGTSVVTASFGGLNASTTVTVAPATLVSIAVTPATASIAVGAAQQFIATGTFSDGTIGNITTSVNWTSNNVAVATVLPTGVATGLTAGVATITATRGAVSGSGVLTVTPAVLVSIAVTPATASILVGATQQFTATGTFSDGTTSNITATAAWTSSNVAVATVLPTGVATGVTAGVATITATRDGRSGSGVLTVTAPVVLTSISLSPLNPIVQIGATRQFFVTALYSDGSTVNVTNQSAYVSAAPAIATVGASTGLATGVAAGSSVVTASFSGRNASTTVTVPAATLVSIAVTPNPANILVGGSQQFTATGTFSDATTGIITNSVVWTSNNLPVATVLPSGVATGVAPGTANITATRGAISNFAVLNVTAVVVVPPFTGINLRSADTFALLAGTSLTNNSGGTTFITGDIGAPSQTTDPVQAPGFSNYKSGLPLTQALADLQLAITDANSRTCTVNSAAGIDLGGRTFTPGVYCYAGAINITGKFTMNGPGLYIFRSASTLDTTANAEVELLGGATAANVFWVPVGATTLAANSVFKGTVMSQVAAITAGDNTTLLDGRLLSAAAVTLRNNQIKAK